MVTRHILTDILYHVLYSVLLRIFLFPVSTEPQSAVRIARNAANNRPRSSVTFTVVTILATDSLLLLFQQFNSVPHCHCDVSPTRKLMAFNVLNPPYVGFQIANSGLSVNRHTSPPILNTIPISFHKIRNIPGASND